VPDPRERVLAAVDADRLVGHLQSMVQAQSYCNTPGESQLARSLLRELQERGLEASEHAVAQGRVQTLGWLRGEGGGPSLMLNGHIDTNMVGEGWTTDPFGGRLQDGCVYGLGVSNMKAADAAMVEAVTAVKLSGVRQSGDVCLALVVGELQGGLGTLRLLDDGVRADYFLVGEPTDLAVLTLHAATFEFFVHVTGRTRHMSKREEGVSAIEKMYAVIRTLEHVRFTGADRIDYAGLHRLNVGVIRGGMSREYLEWRAAMVPDFCTIKVAGRIAPGQTAQSALDDVHIALEDLRRREPDLEFKLELASTANKPFRPPFEVDLGHPFVQSLASAHTRVTGAAPMVGDVAPYKFYGTDAAHLAKAGMIGAVYGPGGKYNTMPDERVEIVDLVNAARVYALMIAETCGDVGRQTP
jgi:acetylornithine deacetylase